MFSGGHGSEVSVIPPSLSDRKHTPDKLTLTAVKDTPIPTYGKRSLTPQPRPSPHLPVDIHHRRCPKPIIGADFLRHFGLLANMRQHQLTNTATHLHNQGILTQHSSPSPAIAPKKQGDPYLDLLSQFPTLTQVCSPDCPVKYDITHHIITTCPPVSARPRRLAPERLQIARREFEHMLQLGIICPSSSAWSSPLHMVPKKTSRDWRPCGDYYPYLDLLSQFPTPHHKCAPLTAPSSTTSPTTSSPQVPQSPLVPDAWHQNDCR